MGLLSIYIIGLVIESLVEFLFTGSSQRRFSLFISLSLLFGCIAPISQPIRFYFLRVKHLAISEYVD